MREVDLVRGGAELDVTDENKVEYVERRFKHAMLDQITAPLSALLRGFYEVVVLFGIESEFEFFVVLPLGDRRGVMGVLFVWGSEFEFLLMVLPFRGRQGVRWRGVRGSPPLLNDDPTLNNHDPLLGTTTSPPEQTDESPPIARAAPPSAKVVPLEALAHAGLDAGEVQSSDGASLNAQGVPSLNDDCA